METVEIECGKCGVYVEVETDGTDLRLIRGCHHYTLDSDLEWVRDEILEALV